MIKSLDEILYEALKRCGGQCEGQLSVKQMKKVRCPEKHNHMGIDFKGIVSLTPYYKTRKPTNMDDIKLLCIHCIDKTFAEDARQVKPRAKKKDPERVEMFDG